MSDEGIQRRRFPRYVTDLDATVYLGSGALEAHIAQISRGGCLINPPLPSQPTPGIKLSFRLAEDLPYINCKAEIVYNVMDRGTGIAFTEISEYNKDLITEFYEKQPAAEKSSGS
jgi:PilZ domain